MLFKPTLFTVIVFCLLTGCKTTDDYSLLSKQSIDYSYDKKIIKWRGTFEDSTSVYYMKLYNEGGTLGICGGRIMERTAVFHDLTSEWFDQAYVVVGRNPPKQVASALLLVTSILTLKEKIERHGV
ncbi:MAG: hypothetical protein CMM52_06045 [Rhodospirillaceae bacterium]|nr:hypothetical protein [Rhodospirillaceae bacterium]|tara:strand:+ start:16060 stop:16437 length:378 start_codon:yes stop_codon:yes gene_type:complete